MMEDYLLGYRIVAPKWADDAFSGEGARKFGGRWNSPGRNMVYLGGSRALSALELLVHLPSPLSRAKLFCLIEIKIPRDLVAEYPARILPENWRKSPSTDVTAEIGDDWYDAGSQLAMTVPSVLIPEEINIILNPKHSDFKKVKIGEPQPFRFDERL